MNGFTILLMIALFVVSVLAMDMKRELEKYKGRDKDIYVKNMSEIMKDAEYVSFKRKVEYILSLFSMPKITRPVLFRKIKFD